MLTNFEHIFSDHQMNRSDEDAEMRAPGDSLERLREICNKSLPQHGNSMIGKPKNLPSSKFPH